MIRVKDVVGDFAHALQIFKNTRALGACLLLNNVEDGLMGRPPTGYCVGVKAIASVAGG